MGFVYKFVSGWNTTDPKTGHRNHDSTMSGDEVLRLTKQGIDLLYRQTPGTMASIGNKSLSHAGDVVRRGADRTVNVVITKGIHQRTTKPHITAVTISAGVTFHLWLSATDTGLATLPGHTNSVVAVSATATGPIVPPVAVAGISRRGSIIRQVMENEQRRIAEEAAERAAATAHVEALMALDLSEPQAAT
jgi:hypothetical protein